MARREAEIVVELLRAEQERRSNHRTATDTCGPVTTTLSVTSDEPVTAPVWQQGLAGLTSPDWQVSDAHHVRLRAERSVRGDGRVYTISITARDAAGGTSTAQVTVTVPRRILGWRD